MEKDALSSSKEALEEEDTGTSLFHQRLAHRKQLNDDRVSAAQEQNIRMMI